LITIINTTSNEELCAFYLDYVNNYLTIDKMAEDYSLSTKETSELLDAGKALNNNNKADK